MRIKYNGIMKYIIKCEECNLYKEIEDYQLAEHI